MQQIFEAAIRVYKGKLCSDPRDQVYGLLGMINPKESSQIELDYGQLAEAVFESACKVITGEDSDESD
jgi:hypothetical protein